MGFTFPEVQRKKSRGYLVRLCRKEDQNLWKKYEQKNAQFFKQKYLANSEKKKALSGGIKRKTAIKKNKKTHDKKKQD